MKNTSYVLKKIDISLPQPLYKLILTRAKKKFRTVNEEICFVLTETLLNASPSRADSAVSIYEMLVKHREKRDAFKAKQQQNALAKQASRQAAGVISLKQKVKSCKE